MGKSEPKWGGLLSSETLRHHKQPHWYYPIFGWGNGQAVNPGSKLENAISLLKGHSHTSALLLPGYSLCDI